MRQVLQAIIIAGGLVSASPVWAEVVAGNNVNCREEPSLSAPIVTTVTRGESVTVLVSDGSWSQVTLEGGTVCWIASRLLESSYRSGDSPGRDTDDATNDTSASSQTTYSSSRAGTYAGRSGSTRSTPAAKPSRTRTASKPSRRRGSGRSGASGGSCPCSGPNVCIGPRGGRYCITSGGNKRYGV